MLVGVAACSPVDVRPLDTSCADVPAADAATVDAGADVVSVDAGADVITGGRCSRGHGRAQLLRGGLGFGCAAVVIIPAKPTSPRAEAGKGAARASTHDLF